MMPSWWAPGRVATRELLCRCWQRLQTERTAESVFACHHRLVHNSFAWVDFWLGASGSTAQHPLWPWRSLGAVERLDLLIVMFSPSGFASSSFGVCRFRPCMPLFFFNVAVSVVQRCCSIQGVELYPLSSGGLQRLDLALVLTVSHF